MLKHPKSGNPKIVAAYLIRQVLEESLFINKLLYNSIDSFPLPHRKFITNITSGTIRNLRLIDFWISSAFKKEVRFIDPEILSVLRVSVFQILFMSNREPPVVVHECVEIIKKSYGKKQAKFANYILRELLRLEPSDENLKKMLGDNKDEFLKHKYSFPDWFFNILNNFTEGKNIKEYLELFNKPLGITLRVEGDEEKRKKIIAFLRDHGIAAYPSEISPCGIYTARSVSYELIKDFDNVYIQDESSQIVVQDMGIEPGDTILDLCAAPGGKTMYISSLVGEKGHVIAVDFNKYKLKQLGESMVHHNKTNFDIKLHDLTVSREEWDDSFNKILLDAPCTSLGTIRRHPEMKWQKSPEDIKNLAGISKFILNNAARYVKPGGIILFSVCTFTKEETDDQINDFIKNHPDFFIEKSYYTLSSIHDNRDLFYIAKIRRSS